MKRAFPHHNPPASLNELQAHLGSDLLRATLPEQHRRVRTSAAVLGLALSMGASSLGLAEDAAVAAEPAVKPAPALMPPTLDKTAVMPEEQLKAVDVPAVTAATPQTPSYADTPVETYTQHQAEPEAKAPVAQEPVQEHVTHVVQSGHTLWRIASAYEVTPASIATANGLPSIETPLEIGEVLRIPVTDTMVYPPREIIAPDSSPRATVAEDESTDAQMAQVTPSTKAHANDDLTPETSLSSIPSSISDSQQNDDTSAEVTSSALDDSKLALTRPSEQSSEVFLPDRVGRRVSPNSALDAASILESPTPTEPLAAADRDHSSESRLSAVEPDIHLNRSFLERESQVLETLESHEVRQGETLISLANRHQTTIEEIARVNGLDDPDQIAEGQRLEIPKQIARRSAPVEVFGEDRSLASVPGKKQRLDLNAATVEDEPLEVALSTLDEERVNNLDRASEVPEIATIPDMAAIPETAAEVDEIPVIAAVDSKTPEVAATDLASEELTSEELASDMTEVESSEIAIPPVSETLTADIARLRDRVRRNDVRRSRLASSPEPSPTAEATTSVDDSDRSLGIVREHSNPQFDRDQVALARRFEREQDEASASESDLASADVATSVANDDDKVAVAPLGSQNYAPLMEPRSVSPELPGLPSSGAYLPKPEQRQEAFDGYIWPAQGVFTSGYGWRWGRMHRGIDVAGPVGTPIVAAAPGTVTYSRWNSGGYGNLVEITHPDGSLTLYAHNHRNLVSEGEEVIQGQQIAEMGSTGFSTGPHVHFEIHRPGQGPTDPMAFLP